MEGTKAKIVKKDRMSSTSHHLFVTSGSSTTFSKHIYKSNTHPNSSCHRLCDAAIPDIVSTDTTLHASDRQLGPRGTLDTLSKNTNHGRGPVLRCFPPGKQYEPGVPCASVQASASSSVLLVMPLPDCGGAQARLIIRGTCRCIAVREQLADPHLLYLERFPTRESHGINCVG